MQAGDPKNFTDDNTNNQKDSVLLFVRIEGEPYCCLGRLVYVGVDLTCSPIAMKWELKDFDKFEHKDYFGNILKAAHCKL